MGLSSAGDHMRFWIPVGGGENDYMIASALTGDKLVVVGGTISADFPMRGNSYDSSLNDVTEVGMDIFQLTMDLSQVTINEIPDVAGENPAALVHVAIEGVDTGFQLGEHRLAATRVVGVALVHGIFGEVLLDA